MSAGALTVIKAIAPIASSLLGARSGPDVSPPPPAPVVQQAPEAPDVATADDIGEEPVVDTEAARIRAQKRRKTAEERRLFSLTETDDTSVILTKSLLGE